MVTAMILLSQVPGSHATSFCPLQYDYYYYYDIVCVCSCRVMIGIARRHKVFAWKKAIGIYVKPTEQASPTAQAQYSRRV